MPRNNALIETFFLSLFAPRRPYPGCGLFLISSCIVTVFLWFLALEWYSIRAYPLLLNTLFVDERMMTVVHYSVLFGAPFIGVICGFLIASFLSKSTTLTLPRARLLMGLLSILPFTLTAVFFLAVALFFFPNGFGVFVQNEVYKVSFFQSYSYDPFPATDLDLTIIRSDGKTLHQELDEYWEPRDGRATVCKEIRTHKQGDRVYFICDNQEITSRTTFVDLVTGIIHVGWSKCGGELHIDNLFNSRKYTLCED